MIYSNKFINVLCISFKSFHTTNYSPTMCTQISNNDNNNNNCGIVIISFWVLPHCADDETTNRMPSKTEFNDIKFSDSV